MAAQCANQFCSVPRHQNEGKLFRVDIEIASRSGASRVETVFLWLCERCAQQFNPKVEVTSDKVCIRLLPMLSATGPCVPASLGNEVKRYAERREPQDERLLQKHSARR